MAFNRFRVGIFIRLLALVATLFGVTALLAFTDLYTTAIVFGLLVIYQYFNMIHYIDRTNRQLTRFLESIQYEDFTQTFERADGNLSFSELNVAFKKVMGHIQQSRAERESQRKYLQTVIQHVNIGLMVYKADGEIVLSNGAAKRILNVTHLKNMNSLRSVDPKLVETLLQMKSGQRCLIKVQLAEDTLQLAVAASVFKQKDVRFVLISIQDIRNELEEKEMEAWQKLTRVLTHEIMNSVTPIASLTATVSQMLVESRQEDGVPLLDTETADDVHDALLSIERRSQGLLHFVETYRSLTRVPKPDFQIFPVKELFGRVHQLMSPQLGEENIAFEVKIEPENLNVTADPDLIEQVLLNLILNAVQALADSPEPLIVLTAGLDKSSRVMFQVKDNGTGILDDVLEKIFIPFFTTKRSGSGIGLSLSRQIMRLHGGSISARSNPEAGTVFTLRF